MCSKKQIPGFFYDEEKRRYFALPNSKNVAEFNSPEIRKLQEQAHKSKRAKVETNIATKIEQETENVKILQKQTELEIQKLIQYTNVQGVINPNIRVLIDCNTPIPNRNRPIQYSALFATYFITTPSFNLSCFSILTDGRYSNLKNPKILIRHENSDDLSEVYSELDLNSEISEYSEDSKFCRIGPYIKQDSFVLCPSCNSSLRRISSAILANKKPFFCFDEYSFVTKRANMQADLHIVNPEISVKSHVKLNIRSELLAAANLDNICCFGYRNGTITIFDLKNAKRHISIDFGTVPCTVALMEFECSYFCVVSGINNNLRSYKLDFELGKAMLSNVFNKYHWGLKVSSNLKLDLFSHGIFAVESECQDNKSLEIQFYSLLCDTPLIMVNGPFRIPNCDNSQYLWNFWNKCIMVYDKEAFSFKIYRDIS